VTRCPIPPCAQADDTVVSPATRRLDAGYSQKDLANTWGGNLLRVLQAAQDHAAKG
jgi:microsomal dipeptidase-like Zn-dependent dipeptidase